MLWTRVREDVKKVLTPRQLTRVRCLLKGKPLPEWGNLRRLTPFSTQFGFDRGTPIDRFYLNRFLERNRQGITGDVLEIQTPMYTHVFGHDIRTAHAVDINPDSKATYICDLAKSDSVIPSDRYDCFLLPNTLCALRDIDGCLHHALRVVRPGGVVLATTAVFVPLMPDYPDYWHLSADGWRQVVARAWNGQDVEVDVHGNCLAAVAAMMQLAVEELSDEELEAHDPQYPVLVTIKCIKR